MTMINSFSRRLFCLWQKLSPCPFIKPRALYIYIYLFVLFLFLVWFRIFFFFVGTWQPLQPVPPQYVFRLGSKCRGTLNFHLEDRQLCRTEGAAACSKGCAGASSACWIHAGIFSLTRFPQKDLNLTHCGELCCCNAGFKEQILILNIYIRKKSR